MVLLVGVNVKHVLPAGADHFPDAVNLVCQIAVGWQLDPVLLHQPLGGRGLQFLTLRGERGAVCDRGRARSVCSASWPPIPLRSIHSRVSGSRSRAWAMTAAWASYGSCPA